MILGAYTDSTGDTIACVCTCQATTGETCCATRHERSKPAQKREQPRNRHERRRQRAIERKYVHC